MKITPGFDKALVQTIKIECVTAAGVFIAGTTDETSVNILLCKILELGPRSQLSNGQQSIQIYAVGDYIMVPQGVAMYPLKYSAVAQASKDKRLPETMMLRILDILCKVEAEDGEVLPDGTVEHATVQVLS